MALKWVRGHRPCGFMLEFHCVPRHFDQCGQGGLRWGRDMRRLRMIGLGALLAVASTAAWAFQEQQGSVPPGGKGGSAAAVDAAPSGVVVPLAGGAAAAARPAGTEIRIPGLGSLGVLPKMDFGLELLYGAAEQKAADDGRGLGGGADDLAIRGTIRKKF